MCTVYIIAFFESVYYYNNNAYKSAQNTKQKKHIPTLSIYGCYIYLVILKQIAPLLNNCREYFVVQHGSTKQSSWSN